LKINAKIRRNKAMPYQVSWLVPQRVVWAQGWGEISAAENQASDEAVKAHIETGQAPVHVLIDVTQVEGFPFSTASHRVKEAREFWQHPNLGWGIICGTDNRVVRFIAEIVMRLAGVKLRLFSTLEEGIAFLEQDDPSLNGLFASPQNSL
jgi:hypothetical protein